VAAVASASAAVGAAAAVRARYHRREAPTRAKALEDARQRCVDAAKPLRSWIGMIPWGGIDLDDELAMKGVMEKLRYERRQITKML
jgi:hypothetical protein